MIIASWFVLGRLLFGVTYLIGGLIGLPTLRTVGFALNLMAQFLLI